MTAPDHTLKPFKNHLHQRGHPYMHQSREGFISLEHVAVNWPHILLP